MKLESSLVTEEKDLKIYWLDTQTKHQQPRYRLYYLF